MPREPEVSGEDVRVDLRTFGEELAELVGLFGVINSDGTLSQVGPGWETELGGLPGDGVGANYLDLVHPDDRDRTRAALDDMRADPAAGQMAFTNRIREHHGSYRQVEWSGKQVRTGDVLLLGRPVRVSDPPRLSDAHKHRLVAENSTDVVALVTPSGSIDWISPAAHHILGHDPEDLIGTDTATLAHCEDLRTLQSLREHADQGKTARGEIRFLAADGSYRWMATVISPARDSGGEVIGRIDTFRDTHDLVITREALARSEQMFRLAMDGAPTGVAVVGLHRRFLQVNQPLCALLERPKSWLLERSITDVMHPDDVEGDLALRDKLISGDSSSAQRQCRWLKPDKTIIHVTHSIGLLRDEHNMPLFYVSHIH